MLFSTASMAVLGFASYASAHMILAKPQPFAGVINSPLDGQGANYPCQLKFDSATAATSMALGSTQPLAFTGGATHGGGSCQISITYDNPPTKNSVFKVIHSIEGGCPTRNNAGNIGGDASAADPDTYSFTIPTILPTGPAILSWTWFNKVGNREMYMNCAPIDITAGSSKRNEEEENLVRDISQLMERDQAAFNSLPNMFTANIKNIGNDDCATEGNVDVQFPHPGSSVDQPGLQAHLKLPANGTCEGTSQSGGSGPSGSSGSATTAAAAAPSSTSAVAQGGVFATTAAASSAAAATTMATSTKAPVMASSAAPAPSASSSPIASSGSTGAMTAGSACSPEGLWNCIGGTSFQQCASGTWSVVQSLAAGTKCKPGQTSAIDITAAKAKRAIRFSSEHVRRHIHRSA